jgi:dUTP pyrophosphatase
MKFFEILKELFSHQPPLLGNFVKLKKLHEDAIIPTYSKKGDACCDVYSLESVKLLPGQRRVFRTGIALGIPNGYEVQIRPRSGLAAKNGFTILNSPATIDSGYIGEILIVGINMGQSDLIIDKGDRIAQMCLKLVHIMDFVEVDKLSNTERNTGGFGSTGK